MEAKEELKKRLTPMQYQVTQEAATERPFTGKYNKCYDKGIYQCIVCQQELFSSDTKYDSGCGWPAFNDVLDQGKVTLHKDSSISGELISSHHARFGFLAVDQCLCFQWLFMVSLKHCFVCFAFVALYTRNFSFSPALSFLDRTKH